MLYMSKTATKAAYIDWSHKRQNARGRLFDFLGNRVEEMICFKEGHLGSD